MDTLVSAEKSNGTAYANETAFSKSKPDGTKKEKPAVHPRLSANIFSQLTFWWLGDLFRLGSKRTIEPHDVYDTLPWDKAEFCMDNYDRISDRLKEKKKFKEKPPSLWSVFLRQYKSSIFFTAFLVILWEGIKISQPVLVGWLVLYFQSKDADSDAISPLTDTNAYIVGGILGLSSMLQAFPSAFFFAIQEDVAMRLRSICCALIFRKSLRLSNKALANASTGRIVNLMSTDVEKFNKGVLFMHFLWVAPLEIMIIMYLMYTEIGFSFVPGLIFILVLLPIQLGLGKTFGKLRLSSAKWTDARILSMSEVLSGMRVIKMYCWEKPFATLVHHLRKSEMGVINKALQMKGLNTAIAVISPKIVCFLIVLTHLLRGQDLRADQVVKLVAWSELLRMGVFTFLANAAAFGIEMIKSVERIQTFLYEEELNDQKTAQNIAIEPHPEINRDTVIGLYGVNAHWETADPHKVDIQDDTTNGFTLHDINMSVSEGQLVALAGTVGSGKSSLLMTLLGEMPISTGSSTFNGEVAYVPQEAWVFAGTIQENILFGQPYLELKYKRIIKACALDRDLELMEFGDQTLVGEKGFSLSGGQRARLNLARAVYRDADIYLMDDPLSAVDSKVGRHIFQNCICGELKHKTRVLVTHQVQFLKDADYVYILDDGHVIKEGKHDTISHDVAMMRSISMSSDEAARSSMRRSMRKQEIMRESMKRASRRRRESAASSVATVLLGEDFGEGEDLSKLQEEEQVTGSVSLGVFARYFGAGYGVITFPVFFILAVLTQGLYNFNDYYLSNWHSNTQPESTKLYIVGGMVGVLVLCACIRSAIYMFMSGSASQNLHKKMFASVIRAPTSFFDKNPTGRILNRFSRDTGFMDDILVQTFHQVWLFLLMFAGIIGFVTYTIYWSLIVTIPIICLIIYIRYYTMKTMRDIKRVEATVRSPVYSHLTATLLGLPVVRAFKMEESFTKTFYGHQDQHTSAWFLFISTSRWFGLRLDWLIATYFIGCIVAAFVLTELGIEALDGGQIGLSLSYISALLGIFQYIMRQTAELESYMTSVERIQQYTKLEPEAAEHTDVIPAETWPEHGAVNFQNMSLAYTADAKNVLNNITLSIKGKEKIGIVGRTGAGKSTLISCLFRLAEPTGNIWVDGHDITTLGLTDVRRKISIIPQDPVLFSGTLRYNLDPLSEYPDEALWKALDSVYLTTKVRQMPGFLSAEMTESGSNFSVGQRQLVCLARAILKCNRILVIDEATANVDQSTDRLIQKTLRTKFENCTVLCIAHRLNTIIDYDKVLVLDQGEVIQFAHPHTLLQNEKGIFHEMVKQTGPASANMLTHLASQAYEGTTIEVDEEAEDQPTGLQKPGAMSTLDMFLANQEQAGQYNAAFEHDTDQETKL